ncbi:MAG: hypothetical protein ACJAXH_003602 [Colwellia sp.]|jgi:hypothetical protein
MLDGHLLYYLILQSNRVMQQQHNRNAHYEHCFIAQ